jgi:hypothetical protein
MPRPLYSRGYGCYGEESKLASAGSRTPAVQPVEVSRLSENKNTKKGKNERQKKREREKGTK